jgi:hypothetical protein
MGAPEVREFLSSLATDRKVAASTQNQAFSALLFLYKEVLKQELPWIEMSSEQSGRQSCPWFLRPLKPGPP